MSQVLNLFQKSVGHQPELVVPPADERVKNIVPGGSLGEVRTVKATLQPSCRAVFHTDPLGGASDRFRLLRMRLREHHKVGRLKTLLITSPLPHDGKSTIAINLATALSEEGKFKVLLVEADLHRPSLGRQLGLKDWDGLSNCLRGDLPAIQAIRKVEPLGWYLLPSGDTPENPTEFLQSSAFHQLKQELLPHFDWILIDSPPVIPLTDAVSLKPHSDGILLVVRAGYTPQEKVAESITLLGKQHIAAMVFNGVEDMEKSFSKYGYYRSEPTI
jgi:capsular exopolysaccharide synthesis family protein